jgi:hypothetical protein
MGVQQNAPGGYGPGPTRCLCHLTPCLAWTNGIPPIALQELRRRIYWKAKSEKAHRFWGIFVHVTRKEALEEAYRIAKRNGGAAGIDGQTFEAIAASWAAILSSTSAMRASALFQRASSSPATSRLAGSAAPYCRKARSVA